MAFLSRRFILKGRMLNLRYKVMNRSSIFHIWGDTRSGGNRLPLDFVITNSMESGGISGRGEKQWE